MPAVLVAGAVPVGLPLHEHTWETFSVHWHADVKIAFGWLKAALLAPLQPGSRVVVISSGAAVFGSPLSGSIHAHAIERACGYVRILSLRLDVNTFARYHHEQALAGEDLEGVRDRSPGQPVLLDEGPL